MQTGSKTKGIGFMTDNKGFIKRTMAGVRIYFVVITVFTAISFYRQLLFGRG